MADEKDQETVAAEAQPEEVAPTAPAEPIRDLADLGAATGLTQATPEADSAASNEPAVAKLDEQGRAYATGTVSYTHLTLPTLYAV